MNLRHKTVLRLWTVTCAVAATVATARGQTVNLALKARYTASCGILPGWDGLVDGVKDSDDPPGCWATADEPEFPKQVVIDLGGLCEVSQVVVHNSTNGNTKQIQVAVSQDGTKYDLLREYVFPPGKYQPLVHKFTPRKARFVRITFVNTWGDGLGGKNIIYLREVEVFGKRLEAAPAGMEAVWREMAGERPFSPVPGWRAVRRYLLEVTRPIEIAVICPGDVAEETLGPGGWLSKGIALLQKAGAGDCWLAGDAQVRVVESDDPERMAGEWAEAYRDGVPDLVIVIPAASHLLGEGQADAVCKLLMEAHRAGASVLICLPLPSTDGQAVGEYVKLRRWWKVKAAEMEAGVLDIAAVIAHRYSWKSFQQGGGFSAERRALAAEAWARLMR